MERILVHPLAGVLSAYGIGMADIKAIRETSWLRPLSDDFSNALEELEQAACNALIEQGRLVEAADFRAEGWQPHYNAAFPPLVFLQLLFGRRCLADLRYALPDVWADEIGRPLLEALFPARPSWVLPLD